MRGEIKPIAEIASWRLGSDNRDPSDQVAACGTRLILNGVPDAVALHSSYEYEYHEMRVLDFAVGPKTIFHKKFHQDKDNLIEEELTKVLKRSTAEAIQLKVKEWKAAFMAFHSRRAPRCCNPSIHGLLSGEVPEPAQPASSGGRSGSGSEGSEAPYSAAGSGSGRRASSSASRSS